MNWAIGQAGSLFTGWISSCLFCPTSRDDESSLHEQSMKQKGAEREMKVCHTQPHLVPPMKLPADDPPSSLPSWVVDGRNLASRASSRASMSFRRKSMATTSLRISAPSEFRRVPTFSMTPDRASFRPLELSLGHLPELPNFEDFHLEGDQTQPPVPVSRPPRAELSRHSRSRSHRPSSSFHLQRKPVGSGSLRSSLATFDHLIEMPPPIPSHTHAPQLSSSSTVTGLTSNVFAPSQQLDPTPTVKEESIRDPPSEAPSVPRTPTLQDRPLATFFVDDSSSAPSTPREAQPPRTPSEYMASPDINVASTPPRSSRVTQWLQQTSHKGMFSPSGSISSWKPTPEKNPFRLRSRTLSGSTVASSISSLTGSLGFKTTTPSETDNITATTIRPPNMDSRLGKDLELPLPRATVDHQRPNEYHEYDAYPALPDCQGQQPSQNGEPFPYNYYENYRHSAVGLAF